MTATNAVCRRSPGNARVIACLSVALCCVAACRPSDSADAADVYSPRPTAEVRTDVLRWATRHGVRDAAVLARINALWPAGEHLGGRETFERLIDTFALADAGARRLIEACRRFDGPQPSAELIPRDESDEFLTAHLRLFYARNLTQRLLYDEALEAFARIDASRIVDPATCLFYRAVCEHQLLLKKEALETLDKLLHKTQGVAASYVQVASLMHDELEPLDEQSLGTVSRKMGDSERRLELGRGGQRVQKVQDEIVESLDEIIKKKEQQANAMSQAGEGQNNSNRSSGPAEDSMLKGQTAPGNVDKKNYKKQGTWGKMDPKAQSQAKDLLSKDFPSNYRQAVEEYFKKLANRPNSK